MKYKQQKLDGLFEEYLERNQNILFISIATSDGFNVGCSKRTRELFAEADKLAAISSSLMAISNSSSKVICQLDCDSVTIESDGCNTLLSKLNDSGKEYVVMIAGNHSISLANLRFYLKDFLNDLITMIS